MIIKKMAIKKLLKLCTIITFVAIFMVASMDCVQAEETLELAKKRGYIRLGIANAPPWCEITSDGKITGGGPDVAIAVLKKLGIKEVKATVLEYGAMIPGLMAKRFDVVAAGLFIKPKRCKAVLFSEPDLCDTHAFAVKAGNPFNLHSFKDIKENPDVKLGVCGGCASDIYASKAGIPAERIVKISVELDAIKMLQDGRIQVYSYPYQSIASLLKKVNDPNIEIVSPIKEAKVSCAAAAFRKEDRNFRDAYDKVLQEMKESGEFDTILKKYDFPSEAAKTTKRVDLCGGVVQ